MAKVSEHINLPLHQEADRIKDNMGNHICYMQRPIGHTARAGMLISCERAACIVRACNSHKDLLAVCEMIKKASDENLDDVHHYVQAIDWDMIEAAIAKATIAL